MREDHLLICRNEKKRATSFGVREACQQQRYRSVGYVVDMILLYSSIIIPAVSIICPCLTGPCGPNNIVSLTRLIAIHAHNSYPGI